MYIFVGMKYCFIFFRNAPRMLEFLAGGAVYVCGISRKGQARSIPYGMYGGFIFMAI